jgi:hypothetical protein
MCLTNTLQAQYIGKVITCISIQKTTCLKQLDRYVYQQIRRQLILRSTETLPLQSGIFFQNLSQIHHFRNCQQVAAVLHLPFDFTRQPRYFY